MPRSVAIWAIWVLVAATPGCLLFDNIATRPKGPAGASGPSGLSGASGAGFALSGNVTGLGAATGLVLANAGDNVTVNQDGAFNFPTKLQDGAGYAVTVVSAPTGYSCVVSGGAGTIMGADVSAVSVACTGPTAIAAKDAPRILFTDLSSGPGTAFVTLFGIGFGATRGASSVTLNGVEVSAYVRWGDAAGARGLETIVVQPGTSASSGSLVVTVGARASNPMAFTIRPGRIFVVSTFGDLSAAMTGKQDGDIVYLHAGTYSTPTTSFCDGGTTVLAVAESEATNAAQPIAFISYPGETAQIGDTAARTTSCICISTSGAGNTSWSNFVFAKLRFTGADTITAYARGRVRFIGNTFTNTSLGNSTDSAAIEAEETLFGTRIWGNHFTVIGGDTSARAAIWMWTANSADVQSDVDIGWNEFDAFNSAAVDVNPQVTSAQLDDIRVHDNYFHDAGRTAPSNNEVVFLDLGANLTTPLHIDVYNNIYKNTGPGVAAQGDAATAVVRIEHNTFFRNNDHEIGLGATAGLLGAWSMRNNIFMSLGGDYIVFTNVAPTGVSASKNLFVDGPAAATWPGGPSAPKLTPASSPLADTTTFALAAGSEAIDGGDTASFVSTDYYGRSRSQGGAPDVGAVEYYP